MEIYTVMDIWIQKHWMLNTDHALNSETLLTYIYRCYIVIIISRIRSISPRVGDMLLLIVIVMLHITIIKFFNLMEK